MNWSLVFRTIFSVVAIAMGAASAEARGDDVVGVVKSVNAKGKTFIITASKTKQYMHVHVGDQTRIETGDSDPKKPMALNFVRIVPGATVTMNDAVVASSNNVFNERAGAVIAVGGVTPALSAISTGKNLLELRTADTGFVFFAVLDPNLFATIGFLIAYSDSLPTDNPLLLDSYVLFAVLCGAASYLAFPAVQRLAIPEVSPTLPPSASLGLMFPHNVTIGIPLYIENAKAVMRYI